MKIVKTTADYLLIVYKIFFLIQLILIFIYLFIFRNGTLTDFDRKTERRENFLKRYIL